MQISGIDTIKYHTRPRTQYEEVLKTTKRHSKERKEVSLFPAGDHKGARHRQASMAKTYTNEEDTERR